MRTFNEIALGRPLGFSKQIARDPMTIGNAIFVAFGASTTSVALIWTVGFVATTAVTSFALNALAPKIDMSSLEGMQANQRTPVRAVNMSMAKSARAARLPTWSRLGSAIAICTWCWFWLAMN